MQELHLVGLVGWGAEDDGRGTEARGDEVMVGEVGAADDLGVMAAANKTILAGEFVDELDGGVIWGAYC